MYACAFVCMCLWRREVDAERWLSSLPVDVVEGRQICLLFKFVGLVIQSVNYKVLKEVIVWEIL